VVESQATLEKLNDLEVQLETIDDIVSNEEGVNKKEQGEMVSWRISIRD
jgi:hypothetical protein